MATNRKATMAKRQREMAQKDRVKDREVRRAERQVRAEARKASGLVGPEIEELPPPGEIDASDDAALGGDDAPGDDVPNDDAAGDHDVVPRNDSADSSPAPRRAQSGMVTSAG